jgi:FtsP/CotA-like multicopper oxidase with cupredoxin domain
MSVRNKKRWTLGALPLIFASLALLGTPSSALPADPIGMVCTNGPTFNLVAAKGHAATPDGNSIFMWGFKPTGGHFQVPGPVLCVNEGQTVTINLTNPSSGGPGEPVSMIFPGQSGVSASGGSCPSPQDCLLASKAAAPGGSVTYSFLASHPGTYLYESGTNLDKQIQMGLYGALVVRPAMGAGFAYNDASTEFNPNGEFLILLGEIDPVLHRKVALGQQPNLNKFDDDYWQINGRSFPDTISDNGASWLPNQPYGALVQIEPYDPSSNPNPSLIRYVNAGMVNHPFHPHGNHMQVIAQDGRLLDNPYEDFTRTIGAGQTYDLLFQWDDADPWISSGDPPADVTIPGFQDLVFKDGATFYSGDPNLGEQGEFPTGITSYSECGEFYFPWHSHALFEFTNFDEGFGGLATLLRVDPPGGCEAVVNTMHVGDLDGTATDISGTQWRAAVKITVHSFGHEPVSGATVSGSWSVGGSGAVTCLTDGDGQCTLTRVFNNSVPSVAFTVSNITKAGLTYRATVNHDPDGDSSGTGIVVAQP